MNKNLEARLEAEIECVLERAGELTPGGKEHRECVSAVTELEKALADLRKTNTEVTAGVDERHMEHEIHAREVALAEKQYKSDKVKSYVEIGLTTAAKVATLVAFVALGGRVLEAEQTGTLVSKLMPNIIRFFTPIK